MRQEYLDLDEVGGLTVNNSLVNQMNLVKELKEHQENVANETKKDLTENFMQTLNAFSMTGDEENHNQNQYPSDPLYGYPSPHFAQSFPPDQNHLEQTMFAATQKNKSEILPQLLQQISNMQNQIANLTLSANTTRKSRVSDNVNPKTGKPWRRYCWTHGCCTHWGRTCPQKASGHKDDATFRNRMGGSNENCL